MSQKAGHILTLIPKIIQELSSFFDPVFAPRGSVVSQTEYSAGAAIPVP
jgi:hypothetical protein